MCWCYTSHIIFASLTSLFGFSSSHDYEHTSLKLDKVVIYAQPGLSGKDFRGLVFANKRTDWIACHNRNSIQWHMYAYTHHHHHCGPVINLRSLVQLIWLKVTVLAVSVELEIDMACVHGHARCVCVSKHTMPELCEYGFSMCQSTLPQNKLFICWLRIVIFYIWLD